MIKKVFVILFIISYGYLWYRVFFYEDILVKYEKDIKLLATAVCSLRGGCQ